MMMMNNINNFVSLISERVSDKTESKSKSVSLIELDELLSTDYSNFLESAKSSPSTFSPLFRGGGDSSPNLSTIQIRNPGIRKSSYTYNFYTIITSILPNWENTVKRNNCFITTTDHYKASEYGSTKYLIIPKNGVKVSYGVGEDFWEDFCLSGINSLNTYNNFFSNFIKGKYITGEYLPDLKAKYKKSSTQNINDKRIISKIKILSDKFETSIEKLSEKLNKVSNVNDFENFMKQIYSIYTLINDVSNKLSDEHHNLLTFLSNNPGMDFVEKYVKSIIDNGTILPVLENTFDPKSNLITTDTIENFYKTPHGHIEVWVGGESLFIDYNLFYVTDNTMAMEYYENKEGFVFNDHLIDLIKKLRYIYINLGK